MCPSETHCVVFKTKPVAVHKMVGEPALRKAPSVYPFWSHDGLLAYLNQASLSLEWHQVPKVFSGGAIIYATVR